MLRNAIRAVKMPVKTADGRIANRDVSILYPHVLFAVLYNYCYGFFVEKLLGGAKDKVEEFWTQVVDHPGYRSHPMHRHQYFFKQFGVPLSMHGDGTATTGIGKCGTRMADTLSWCSCLLGKSQSKLGHFIILMILATTMVAGARGGPTEEAFSREICWSLYWLYQGLHPDRDANNRMYEPCDPEYEMRLQPLAAVFLASFGFFKET